MTTTTETTAPAYWVTTKGGHRHASYECANQRRHILVGPVWPAGAEHAELPLCEHCCDATEVAEVAIVVEAKAAERAAARCAGSGQVVPDANAKWAKPRGTCPVCGKNVAAARGSRKAATHGA